MPLNRSASSVTHSIALVHGKLESNRKIKLTLVVIAFLGYGLLSYLSFLRLASWLGFVLLILFPILGWVLSARLGFLKRSTRQEAASKIDALLALKERTITLEEIAATTDVEQLPQSDAKREILEQQILPELKDLDLSEAAPQKLGLILKLVSWSILPVWLAIIYLGLLKEPASQNYNSSEAQLLDELTQDEPDLPEEIKESLQDLAQDIEEYGIKDSSVQTKLSQTKEKIEEALKSLEQKEPNNFDQPTPTPPISTPEPQNQDQPNDSKEKDTTLSKSDDAEQEEDQSKSQQTKEESEKEDSGKDGKQEKEGKQSDKNGDDEKGAGKKEGAEDQADSGDNGKGATRPKQSGESDSDQQGQSKDQSGSESKQKDGDDSSAQGEDGKEQPNDKGKKEEGQGKKPEQGAKENNSSSPAKSLEKAAQAVSQMQQQDQGEGNSSSASKKNDNLKEQSKGGAGKSTQKKPDGDQKQEKNKEQSSGGNDDSRDQDDPTKARQDRAESSEKSPKPDKNENQRGEKGSLPDRNAGLRELPDQGEQSSQGLGGEKGFKEELIEAKDEKLNLDYTGEGGDTVKNDEQAKTRTGLANVTLSRPETKSEGLKQEIPLEYKDILE